MFLNIHAHQGSPDSEEKVIHSVFPQGDIFPYAPEGVFSAALHPCFLSGLNLGEAFLRLTTLIGHPACIAIGETGLDGRFADIALQEEVFIRHIELAKTHCKPLILHCVRKHQRIMHLLEQEHFTGRVIWHGWNKGTELAARVLKLGHYLSLGPAIPPKLNLLCAGMEDKLAGQLFFETDTQEISVRSVYEKWAAHLAFDLHVLEQKIEQNAQTVFGTQWRFD